MLSLLKPVALFLTLAFALSAFAQTKASNRIQQAIDDRETVELQGSVRPTLHAAVDRGRMDGATRLQVSMAFKRSAEQEGALEKLLAERQIVYASTVQVGARSIPRSGVRHEAAVAPGEPHPWARQFLLVARRT